MSAAAGLSPGIIALVLLASLLHASWNAAIKTAIDPLTGTAVLNLTCAAVGLTVALFVAMPAGPSWVFILLSATIHLGYFGFLISAYRLGDLSQVYPLARGSAPLIVAAVSGSLIGETLSTAQLVGVALLCLGIGSLALGRLRALAAADPRPVVFALATGVTIAAYTVSDGLGVRRSGSPLGYIAWLYVLDGFTTTTIAWWRRGRGFAEALGRSWKFGIAGGIMAALGYGIIVWCFDHGAIAPIAALRETSVVIAAAIGTLFLGEPLGARRIIAAALVAAGIVTMNLH